MNIQDYKKETEKEIEEANLNLKNQTSYTKQFTEVWESQKVNAEAKLKAIKKCEEIIIGFLDHRLKKINVLIEKKQKEFKKTAKQCSFCGNYHGDLKQTIDELISEKVNYEEIKQEIKNE